MKGSIQTASLSEVEKEQDNSQLSLSDYGASDSSKTYIAVVSQPNDTGILEATDEWIEELGMPERDLNDFRSLRNGYNSQDPVECHNKSYEKCNLDSKFEAHTERNNEAREAINRIADRVEHGEEIVLVCFEESPKKCHRHKLAEIIRNEIEKSVTAEPASSFADYT